MRQRFANHNASTFIDLVSLGLNPKVADIDKAVNQLEDCVKNGLFYQAAHLSDWISFVAKVKLRKHPHLGRRVAIERLKRLGYLGFIPEEWICREEFCREYKLDDVLNFAQDHVHDELRFHLFTAIGHTLWHTQKVEVFETDINTCQMLHDGLTNTEGNGKKFVDAFLNGLRGRQAYLQGKPAQEVMEHFDQGLDSLSQNEQNSRAGLHLINYYARHLLAFYEIHKTDAIAEKINELFNKFETCRQGTETEGLKPLKTLLQIHFLILKIKKLTIDDELNKNNNLDPDLNKELEHAKTDLLFTSIMLGLGYLNPCPPLLKQIHQFFNKQRDLFDVGRAKKHLKDVLKKIDWRSMEKVAAVFYKQQGYEVKELPENTRTFDLLLERTEGATTRIIGVQVKHWKDGISASDFNNWLGKAVSYASGSKISEVIFFSTKKQDQSISIDHKALSKVFPGVTEGIQFVTLDEAIDMLWAEPGCLPTVYGIISSKT